MKKRIQKQELTEVPEEFTLEPIQMGQKLVAEHGTKEGFRLFTEWVQCRSEWGDKFSVCMDPDYYTVRNPGTVHFRVGPEILQNH